MSKALRKRNKFHKVMKEFKEKKLKTHGKVVRKRKQAIAIAISEANKVK